MNEMTSTNRCALAGGRTGHRRLDPHPHPRPRRRILPLAIAIAAMLSAAGAAAQSFTPPLRSTSGDILACVVQNLGPDPVAVHATLFDSSAPIDSGDADVAPGTSLEVLATTADVTRGYCRFDIPGSPSSVRGFIHLRNAAGGDVSHALAAAPTGVGALAPVETVSPPVINIGEQIGCVVQNLGGDAVDVTADILHENGSVVATDTDPVEPGAVRVVTRSTAAQYGASCRFNFTGNPNEVRTFLTTYEPGVGTDTRLLLPASTPVNRRSTRRTPGFVNLTDHAAICVVQNLDTVAVDVTATMIEQDGSELASDSGTVPAGEMRFIVGYTDPAYHAQCRFEFSHGTKARGYIVSVPPGLGGDTAAIAEALPPQGDDVAKFVHTATLPLRSIDAALGCAVFNTTEAVADVRVELRDSSGAVGSPSEISVEPGRSAVAFFVSTDLDDGYCRFSFEGNAAGVRGLAILLQGNGGILLDQATLIGPATVATRTPTATPTPTAVPPTATSTASPTVTAIGTATATPTHTDTPAHTNTPTHTPTGEATATATAAISATPSSTVAATTTPSIVAALCAGDCDGDGTVAIAELVLLANLALDGSAPDACPSADANADGAVSVNELVQAVGNALTGCA